MSDDPNAPRNLITASNEIEAAAIVNDLLLYGIEAYTTAADPIGFDVAQATRGANILVRRSDLDRARLALAKIQKEHGVG